jgi:hypothetical protein
MKRKLTSDMFLLVVGDARFAASKALLSEKSPVFNAMFENEMNESVTNELVITDFSKEVVECFLFCLENDETNRSEVVGKFPKELLSISNKYQVISLVQEIEQHLLVTLNIENALSLLQLSDLLTLNALRVAAIKTVALNISLLSSRCDLVEILGKTIIVDLMTYMQENLNPNLTNECTSNTGNPANYKVVVSGCGISEVNGTYRFLGIFNSAGCFIKHSHYNGSFKRFFMRKNTFKADESKMGWFLSFDFLTGAESMKFMDTTENTTCLFLTDPSENGCTDDNTLPHNIQMFAVIGSVAEGCAVPVLKCMRDI